MLDVTTNEQLPFGSRVYVRDTEEEPGLWRYRAIRRDRRARHLSAVDGDLQTRRGEFR